MKVPTDLIEKNVFYIRRALKAYAKGPGHGLRSALRFGAGAEIATSDEAAAVADRATLKAHESGTAEDHLLAALANQAAAERYKNTLLGEAADRRALAKAHEKRAQE